MADFNISKRIVPTVEIRRQDDLLVVTFGITVVAGVGTFATAQIFNNTTDRLMRLRSQTVSVAGITEVGWRLTQTDLAAGVVVQSFADTRKENFSSTLIAKANAVAAGAALAADQMHRTFLQATQPYQLPPGLVEQVVLAPGWGLSVGVLLANINGVFSFAYQSETMKPTRIPNG